MLLDMLTADGHSLDGHSHSHAHSHSHSHSQLPAASRHGAYSLAAMPLSILGSVLRYRTASPTSTLSPSPTSSPSPPPSPTLAARAAPSRPASSSSSSDRPRKKAARPKTSYLLARPPPTVHPRSKLHIRPKVQLQLHQLLAAHRPRPVYEVIPFSLLAPPSTRRLARAFNTRDRLGHHDLLVVRAADYGHADDDVKPDDEHKSDDERWGSRHVVAVICPAKTDKGQLLTNTDICMDDGTTRWEVTPMANGGYEFNSLDEHGLALKARWVLKPPASRRISAPLSAASQASPLSPAKDDAKWNFSTISPTSRRHPVIATMTRTRIDVYDAYTMPAATQPPTPTPDNSHLPASPALTPASIDAASFLDAAPSAPITTDDALRRFIVVSGIWVSSLHDGFELTSSPSTYSFTSCPIRPPMGRTVSMSFLDSPRSASPASNDEAEKSIPKLLRNTSHKLNRHASFTDPPASPMSAKVAPPSPAIKTRTRRANTTGTHNLRSMTGSLKRRYGIPSQVETLSETDEDRENKRSEEFWRLKKLAMPTPVTAPPADTPVIQPPPRPPVLVIPAPTVIRPSTDGPASPMLLPSPQLPESDRTRKTQSAFNPITTAGMWDSGVTDGPGLKRRPTSMFVMNERKKKEEKKRGRSEGRTMKQEKRVDRSPSKEDFEKGTKDKDCTGMRQKLRKSLKGMFARKDKP